MKLIKRIILLPVLFFFHWAIAQDAHFSHTWNETSELNPASTASGLNQIRLGAFYRTQWMAIPQPYQHYGAIADINFKKIGFGLSMFSNHAGPASLNTTKAKFTGAWHARLASNARLSVGFGAGMLQKRVNPSSFKFDKQFVSGQGFDSNNDNGEVFLATTGAGFDLSAGVELEVPFSSLASLRGGLAIDHVNQPKFSFIEAQKTAVYTKWTGYAQLEFQASTLLTIAPRVAYRTQGPANELLLGLEGAYQLNEQNSLKLGAANRLKDAFIVNAGIELNKLEIGMSYDLNSSGLKTASKGNGALEFMLIYTFNRKDTPAPLDRDLDGIPDHKDNCPDVAGLKKLQGCPKEAAISTAPSPIVPSPVVPQPSVSNDRDADGIPDHLDDCPDTPGKYRFQGCNDRDEDGIWDDEDRCPNLFGVRENGGCPSRLNDTDGDGVLDHADNCKFIKGDPAKGGCPDTDKDGIIDPEDNCPYIKGVASRQGCPLEIGQQPVVQGPLAEVRLQNVIVFFDSDKSIIKPQYYGVLTEMARVLQDRPEIEVLLSGHTDKEGSANYNFSLSERRNLAVRDYLIAMGAGASQIRLLAYGETIPRATNATTSGMEENRRVEVVVWQR